jgi:copper resistance protein C
MRRGGRSLSTGDEGSGWRRGVAVHRTAWGRMAVVFLESRGKTRLIRLSVWVAVIGLLLGVLSSLIMATAAEAHAELLSINPKDGAALTQGPTQVVLTFSEPVSTSFATVIVTGPSGSVSSGKASVRGAVVTQALQSQLPGGAYRIAYRVVSDDGHPVSDTSTFTVAAASASSAAGGSPTSSASPDVAGPSATPAVGNASADPAGGSDGRVLRIGLAVGVAALALAGGTALIAASRRRTGE